MLELTPDNAVDYLRRKGWVGPGPVAVDALGGGVSNAVLRVRTPEYAFILKQSRPQLRTRDAWFSDLDRVYREQEVMQVLHPLLPAGVVPQVLFSDRDEYVFAMSCAPNEARPWKETLLAGVVDRGLGERAGAVLGRIHDATARDPALIDAFRDRTVFVQLRVDPFYRRIQERRPEVAHAVAPLIDGLLSAREALCHGDYSPKNMLIHTCVVSGQASGGRQPPDSSMVPRCRAESGGLRPPLAADDEHDFTLVDYETAHQGDPTMDLGFFLSHLLLKAARRPAGRQAFFDLTRAFWRGYAAEAAFAPRAELGRRAVAHCGLCLLARIDGTSPVEYLPQEPTREAVRRLGRGLLLERPAAWEEALSLVETELHPLEALA